MFKITLVLLIALLSGCASDGNANVSFGIGSFGSSGGVSVGGSTSVPVNSHKNPLPFEQLFLNQDVLDAVFPARELPFTAEEADVKTLDAYAKSDATPNVSSADRDKISICRAGKARCRVQLLDSNPADQE